MLGGQIYIPAFERSSIPDSFTAMTKLVDRGGLLYPTMSACHLIITALDVWEEMTTRKEFRTRFFDCSSAENVFIEVFVGVLNQNPDFASAQCPVGHFLMNKIFPLMARALFHAMGSNLVKDRNSGIHDRALKRGNDGKPAITRSRETSKRQRLQGEEKTE